MYRGARRKDRGQCERIIPELRTALQEHSRLAKDFLDSQVDTLTLIDAISRAGTSET